MESYVRSRLKGLQIVSGLTSVESTAIQHALLPTSMDAGEDVGCHRNRNDDVLLSNSSSNASFGCQFSGTV